MNQKIQASQVQVSQQKEHAEQLQARLNSMEGQVIDQKYFQAQSLEEAKAARVILQKAIIYSANEETSKATKMSAAEQIRGDIILKLWETNIIENKRIVKEIRDDCEEVFDLLDKGSLNMGKGNCIGLLGQINIVRHQLNFRENLSEIQTEISRLREMDVTLIDRLLVETNLKLQSIKFADKGVEYCLSKIQRKIYLLEAKDLPKPPRNFTQFLERCIEFIGSKEGESSTK
jgi:hypothetical protein